jgi:3,4-dihydroxy 2-butanone 4-phosphate synthase/GTP cyclohydrolase II
VTPVADTRLPTAWGEFRCRAFADGAGTTHLALVMGDPGADGGPPPLVRVHSECLTGDVFGSRRCDCGAQLSAAMAAIAAEGRGVVVYLRGHEGRGIGLEAKLRAYEMQDDGYDTVDANEVLGFPIDGRDYAMAAPLLAALGLRAVRLATNNPRKVEALAAAGIGVERVPALVEVAPEAKAYLRTKRDRLGHLLPADRGSAPPPPEELP